MESSFDDLLIIPIPYEGSFSGYIHFFPFRFDLLKKPLLENVEESSSLTMGKKKNPDVKTEKCGIIERWIESFA